MTKWARKRKRRLLFILGILILIFITLLVLQVTRTEPTCFDGQQNGQETGVDCGGMCQRLCMEEVRDIVVWWERPFRVSNGLYNVIAYFENQNLESGIQEVQYEFRLYDYDNILVSEPIVGTTFIEPNKRSAIFEPGIQTGDSEAYTAFFKLSSVREWERTDQDFIYNFFRIEEPLLTNQLIAPKLQADITNISLTSFEDVPVVVILYNQEDNAIAASRTYLDRIDQGTTETAYFSWPEPFSDPVSRIEVIPRVNPFEVNLN